MLLLFLDLQDQILKLYQTQIIFRNIALCDQNKYKLPHDVIVYSG